MKPVYYCDYQVFGPQGFIGECVDPNDVWELIEQAGWGPYSVSSITGKNCDEYVPF